MSRSIDWNDLYKRYKKEYNYQRLKKAVYTGDKMYKPEFKKENFVWNVEQLMKDGKKPQQAIELLAKEQAYKYSWKTAKRWKKTAREYDLEWDDEFSVRELANAAVDVSALNDALKAQGISNSYDRAKIIGEEFFGVDPVTGKSK